MVLLASVIVMAGCSSDDADDGAPGAAPDGSQPGSSSTVVGVPEDLATSAPGSLTACVEVPKVPYAFEEGGEVAGIDADLVRALGGRLALTAAYVDLAADELFPALADDRCDVALSAIAVGTRLPDGLVLSDPYLSVEQSLLVRAADQDQYRDLASLRGRRIGVQPGTAGVELARTSAADATVVEFGSPAQLLAALGGGQVDAVVQDFPVNAHHATTTGATAVVATFPEAPVRQLAVVLREGDADFVQALNSAVAQVTSDDTFPSVLRRYLGVAPDPA